MAFRDPKGMDDDELLDEIDAIVEELLAMGEAPSRISGFDKVDWSVGLGLNLGGLAAGGPFTPIGIGLLCAGFGWFGYTVLRKLGQHRGNLQRIAYIDRLRVRRALLWSEWRRRNPGAP